MNTTQYADTISSPSVQLKDRMHDVVTALKNLAVAVFMLLCEKQAHNNMRQKMKHLDDRILDDIGKTRSEVDIEASKHFWL